MGYPWPKHGTTPEQIWTSAEEMETSAGDYENLSTNVWKAHGPASEGVAGTIAGPVDQIPPTLRREAFALMQAAVVGGAAVRGFGDAVLIFNHVAGRRDHDATDVPGSRCRVGRR